MNLTQLLSHFGLGDGEGNTSLMRVVTLLLVLAVLSPKIALAIKSGQVPAWTHEDMEMLGIALGAKLFQNGQESKPSPPEPPAKP